MWPPMWGACCGRASSRPRRGLPTDKAKVEGLRSRLKLLAARGWLGPAPGGLLTIPDYAGKTPKFGK